jgi:hypothetical protein
MNQKEIIEAMEGCRSERDILRPPNPQPLEEMLRQDDQLRERYRRIHRWDQALSQSLDDCPVPYGLCARLLGALECSESEPIPPRAMSVESIASDQPMAPEPATAERPENHARQAMEPPPQQRIASKPRRWLVRSLGVAGSLSAAVLIFVSVWWNPFGSPVPQLTAEFAEQVIQWTQVAAQSNWRTDFGSPHLRFDPRVRARPHRWTSIPTRFDATTTVYDLSQRHGETVYLFCFPAKRSSLPSAPPEGPFSTTGGFSIGAWQAGDLVFVLAVRGNQQHYRGLIQAPVILGAVDKDPAIRLTGRG